MSLRMHEVELDHPGSYWTDGTNFHFTALSLSDEFACDYVMDILIAQTPNTNITYRHRHTLSSDKVIPIFGNAVKSERIKLEYEGEERSFLRTEFKIPLKAPNGMDLDENIVYAEWVRSKYDAGDPVGISHHFQTRIKDGKAYYANLLEIAGTPNPACKQCKNIPRQIGEVSMNKEELEALKKMTPDQLQEKLEKITLELETAQKTLEEKEAALKKFEDDTDMFKTEKQKLEQKTLEILEQTSKDMAKLKLENEEIKKEMIYERTKGPIVRAILEAEGRPELEDFYKSKEIDYLNKVLEKWKQPKPDVNTLNPLSRFQKAQQALEDGGDITFEDQLAALSPNLRAEFKKLKEKGGM